MASSLSVYLLSLAFSRLLLSLTEIIYLCCISLTRGDLNHSCSLVSVHSVVGESEKERKRETERDIERQRGTQREK